MSKAQVVFYKAKVVEVIYKHLKGTDQELTKAEIDQEIKENAGFIGSTKDATTEEMSNLIAWAFVYSDQYGLNLDYPPDELDDQINFNWQ